MPHTHRGNAQQPLSLSPPMHHLISLSSLIVMVCPAVIRPQLAPVRLRNVRLVSAMTGFSSGIYVRRSFSLVSAMAGFSSGIYARRSFSLVSAILGEEKRTLPCAFDPFHT
jgi:hypothetical protein